MNRPPDANNRSWPQQQGQNQHPWNPPSSVPQRPVTGQLPPPGFMPPPMQQPARHPTGSLTPSASSPSWQPGQRSPSGQLMPPGAPLHPAWGNSPVQSGVPPTPVKSPPRQPKRKNNAIYIVLALCAVLIGGASIAGFLFVNGDPSNPSKNNQATNQTTTPQASPTLSPHQRAQQLAAQYVEKMTLEDMVSQLIFVDNRGSTDQIDLDYMVEEQHIGGILMGPGRLDSKEQVQEDTQRWQGNSPLPLFVATEDEGGWVKRLREIYPDPPSATEIGQTGDPAVATAEGKKMAGYLKELQLNTTFTPVIDIGTEGGYMATDLRTFGSTAEEVIKYAGPYLAAMQKEGIVGSIKHFPGIGRLQVGDDPHAVLPELDISEEELYASDLLPFKNLIQSKDAYEHPGFVMMTYVLIPSIDPNYSAQYSKIFIQDILRKEFGYDGVVITDALIMFGSQIDGQVLTLEEATVAALLAGNDMLLGISNSDQVAEVITTVETAINEGTLTRERIKESVTRVLTLKLERGILSEDALKV